MGTIILNPFEIFGAEAPPVDDSFKMTVSMSALETMIIPAAGTNDFIIDWGDGSGTEHITTSSPSHEYTDADNYQIIITGTMTSFRFANTGNKLNLLTIDQFGDTSLIVVNAMCRGCTNLTSVNGIGFDTSGVTSMSSMFRDCTSLSTLDVSSWDTSILNNISRMFQTCSSMVTINTNSWNTSSIANCSQAFRDCTSLTSSFDEFRWWNRTDDLTSGGTPDPIGTFANCFTSSTSISNYASIPNDWKGL